MEQSPYPQQQQQIHPHYHYPPYHHPHPPAVMAPFPSAAATTYSNHHHQQLQLQLQPRQQQELVLPQGEMSDIVGEVQSCLNEILETVTHRAGQSQEGSDHWHDVVETISQQQQQRYQQIEGGMLSTPKKW